MKVVIPMAGRGSRFAAVGYTEPKPLIEVAGKPMIQWAIESVCRTCPWVQPEDFIFVILREHDKKYQIGDRVRALAGNGARVIVIDDVTAGAACTVLKAKEYINTDEDIMTCDSDQFFVCPAFAERREQAVREGWGGLIPTAESTNLGYSYAKVGSDGNVTETAEKQLVSTHAAIGIYYFGKGSYFVEAIEHAMANDLRHKNEFYMCPLYNFIIGKKRIVRIVPTELWMTLGTPDEAAYFAEHVPVEYR